MAKFQNSSQNRAFWTRFAWPDFFWTRFVNGKVFKPHPKKSPNFLEEVRKFLDEV